MKGKRSKKSYKYSKVCKRNKTKKQHGYGNQILKIRPDYAIKSSESISITANQQQSNQLDDFISGIEKEHDKLQIILNKFSGNTKIPIHELQKYIRLYKKVLKDVKEVDLNKEVPPDTNVCTTINLPYVLFLHVRNIYNDTFGKMHTLTKNNSTNLESSTNA